MALQDDIAVSARWLDACSSRIDGASLQDSTRNRVSAALLHLALEHHGAIQVLASYRPSPLHGSAATLLRPQFEACIRGIWYHRCATDKELEKFTRGATPPAIDTLISDIETLPDYDGGRLKETKKAIWRIMNALTHGGSSQVASRNTPTEIASNYTDDQVRGIVHWASTVTLVTSDAFAKLLQDNLMANDLLSTYQNLFAGQQIPT